MIRNMLTMRSRRKTNFRSVVVWGAVAGYRESDLDPRHVKGCICQFNEL